MLVHRFNLLAIVFMLLCVLATAQAASVGGKGPRSARRACGRGRGNPASWRDRYCRNRF